MKRGFTLVELLAVTVLLALIMAVSYPTLFKTFEDKEIEIDSSKKQIIENAAINYVKLNINEYPYKEGNTCLFLKELIDKNKINIDIDEDLSDRIIKINMHNNKYSAEVLDKNATCQADGIIYEIKKCTTDLSNNNYKLTDNKTTYYKANNVLKQIDVIEGTNIKNKDIFFNQISAYENLNNIIKNNSNVISTIDINQDYFRMYTEINNPSEITLNDTEKQALESAPIFYNSGVIKTICE